MSLIYVPRQTSPFQQMLPSFLQNMMFNQLAQKREAARAQAARTAAEQKELRGYKAAGWRESEAQKPVITIGGKGLVPPEVGYELRKQNGRTVLVETRRPYGETAQVQSAKALPTEKETSPKTAMAAFLQQNPRATPKQIADFQQTLRSPKEGFRLVLGDDGKVRQVAFGPGVTGQGPMGELSRGAKGQFQKELESATGHYQQLERAMSMFKPQHHRWLNQGLHFWTKIKEKGQGIIPGVKLTPKEKEDFAEYTRYKKALTSSYAQRVHELGKGTLTKHETKIYGGALAQPGMSETEIIETAKENMVELQMSIARKRYYLTSPEYGATEKERLRNFHKMRKGAEIMSVADFEQMIDAQYARELNRLRTEQPQAPYELIKEQAKAMIKATFFGF